MWTLSYACSAICSRPHPMPCLKAFNAGANESEKSAQITPSHHDSSHNCALEMDHPEPTQEPQVKEVRDSKPLKKKPAEASRTLSISSIPPPPSFNHGAARSFNASKLTIPAGAVTCDFATGDQRILKAQWGMQQPPCPQTSSSVEASHQCCLVPDVAVIEVFEWLFSDEISMDMRPVCPLWCQIVDAAMRRRVELFCKAIWDVASNIMSLMQIRWGQTLVFSRTDLDLTVTLSFNCIGFRIWITQPRGLMINASFIAELDQSADNMFDDGCCPEPKKLHNAYSTFWPKINALMQESLVPEVKKWRSPAQITQKPEIKSVLCQSHCCWIEVPCISTPSTTPNSKAAPPTNAQTPSRRSIKMTMKVSDAR
eukprot:gnl/MRDRNA2_/MRDRNA2_60876_c0_seq1.p1 gnl/MRDRNA2_/MRDRNA2_60876_c0~~gnl/MRDRNA2_/MRDRNA2_60876_c0_seq1.p1  ORF type:complete len:369 (+),score=55.65 gnl/MRDRNA2_/MRDRNA2_60876_c0_seq1:85-1191(+)